MPLEATRRVDEVIAFSGAIFNWHVRFIELCKPLKVIGEDVREGGESAGELFHPGEVDGDRFGPGRDIQGKGSVISDRRVARQQVPQDPTRRRPLFLILKESSRNVVGFLEPLEESVQGFPLDIMSPAEWNRRQQFKQFLGRAGLQQRLVA